jgi:hypothetical protein
MQYWLEKKLTKANYMKLPELFQPVEKKGKWASSIAPIIVGPEIDWTDSKLKAE